MVGAWRRLELLWCCGLLDCAFSVVFGSLWSREVDFALIVVPWVDLLHRQSRMRLRVESCPVGLLRYEVLHSLRCVSRHTLLEALAPQLRGSSICGVIDAANRWLGWGVARRLEVLEVNPLPRVQGPRAKPGDLLPRDRRPLV